MILSISPFTSHRLQHLNRTFFGPLRTYYNQEIEKWLLNHPDRRVSHFDVVGIFNKAYLQSADVQKAAKSFKCTGIVPFNSNIFTDADFAAANVTNNQDEQPQVDLGNTAALFHQQVFKFQFHLYLQGKEMLQKLHLKKLLTQVIILLKKQPTIAMNCSIPQCDRNFTTA